MCKVGEEVEKKEKYNYVGDEEVIYILTKLTTGKSLVCSLI